MTTYTAFVDSLEALTVTGVTRRYTSGAPSALNTADLPAQWVELPRGDNVLATANPSRARTLTADLIFALEPVGQDTRPANQQKCITLMDAIETAFATYSEPTLGAPSLNLKLVIVPVNTIDYWAVAVEVTALD